MDQRSLLMAHYFRKISGKYKNGLKEIVFRDNSLGMVGHWQNSMWNGRKVVSDLSELVPKNYYKYMARQNGFMYFVADYVKCDWHKNREILEQFVKYRGNALLEIRMLPEPVVPMIPGTKAVDEIILPYGMKLDPADLLIGKRQKTL